MHLLTHLNLGVQRLIGRCVELREDIVDGIVTGRLTRSFQSRRGRRGRRGFRGWDDHGFRLEVIRLLQPLVVRSRFVP